METNHIYDPTRTIHVPLSGYVDITGMEAIVEHPHFARLRFRRQLGFTCMVKVGGFNSRFEHSVGTLDKTRAMLRRFRVSQNDPLFHAMETFGLIHDLGHGPTSHELEYVLPDNHEAIGLGRAEEMRDAIATYADVDLVLALMRGKHPWSILVKHKVFGADKLDYLELHARIMHHPLMQRITDRQALSTAACFKLAGYDKEERCETKGDPAIFGVPYDTLEYWSSVAKDAKNILELERAIEQEAGCPERSVFLVQTDPLEKLVNLPEILVYSRKLEEFRNLYETSALSRETVLQRIHRAYYFCVMCTPEVYDRLRAINFSDFFEQKLGKRPKEKAIVVS